MPISSMSKRGVWTACAMLLACGTDIATSTVGLSGGETGDDTTGAMPETGDEMPGSMSADETMGGGTMADESETGVDPSDGTDDGGIGGGRCMPVQDGLCTELGAEVYCYSGPAGTCGVGSCNDGTQTCEGFDLDLGEWGPCVGDVFPETEVCDRIDNDCDGEVDEDTGTVACGQGVCAHDVSSCDDCDPMQGATDEVCNDGLDNDCDGETDECGCGNGSIDAPEQCDGNDLGGVTCEDLGFGGGALGCNGDCTFDTSACDQCGDGAIDAPEQCDGNALGGATCVSLGHDGGTLDCANDCMLDESGCFDCGDGAVDGSEECDGNNLGGATCVGLGHDGGTLTCANDCQLNESGCTDCGDGVAEGNEECDGNDLEGATCASLGHDGGTLSCANNCNYNESACTDCGDGDVEGSEECDGNDLDGQTCQSQGFDGGVLDCTNGCALDTSGCTLCAPEAPGGFTFGGPGVGGGPGGCNDVIANLTCSADYAGVVTDGNGNGDIDGPYSCGEPFAPLGQPENEDVYAFVCQADGDVDLQLTDMNCDLDIYVLEDTCNADNGCVAGSTNANASDDQVTFTCTAGQTYYIVIEGYGWQNIFPPGGQCGNGEGDYVLHFATGDLTGGCLEDCDDGIDNDADGDIDCADANCIEDPACMCP